MISWVLWEQLEHLLLVGLDDTLEDLAPRR